MTSDPNDGLHTPALRLDPRRPPPAHYYADNLLLVLTTVLERYGDILTVEERDFAERIRAMTPSGQRLLARILGRRGPLLREDGLAYPEVADVEAALGELARLELIERCPAAPLDEVLALFTVAELARLFWDVPLAGVAKVERIERIAGRSPGRICRWRAQRACRWLRLRQVERFRLFQLLFFGDGRQDLTTFVMRDLGVFRFEAVTLSKRTRQFSDRAALDRYLALAEAHERIHALGPRPQLAACREEVAELLAGLWQPVANRLLERRRSNALNQLGRNLERVGEFDLALTCYRRATLAPARERIMRILRRLGDGEGVEAQREVIVSSPWTALEADFAKRFARPFRRSPPPVAELPLTATPSSIERHALSVLTAGGGTGWHLENNLPMAMFALAYWSWLFAPVEGAFVNPFQTGPLDLFWRDFFQSRVACCEEPLAGPLKPLLRDRARAKAGIVNRLFNWQRFTPAVAEAVIDAMPEEHLRALLTIVREDLAGRRAGFPDLTVVYGPGRYEFVEVKGPNDQLQIHQRLWIEALVKRGLPVRVLRFRRVAVAVA